LTTFPIGDTLLSERKRLPLDALVPLLRDTLAREGRLRWQVEGRSMLPALPPGCTIEIRALDGEPRLGDLLVFAGRDALVVHRLVAKRGSSLILQGDNRGLPDPPVTAERLIGRVERATADEKLLYPHRFLRIIAGYRVLRYHTYRALRLLRRVLFRSAR
jgi:hypothetical protein